MAKMTLLLALLSVANVLAQSITIDPSGASTSDAPTPSPTCLNCKLTDSTAPILYSYSYCKKTNECLADEWNYINAFCESGWVRGWMIDIDKDCNAMPIYNLTKCPQIISENNASAPATWVSEYSLPIGAQCDIYIDATFRTLRIRFEKTEAQLGVLFSMYEIGDNSIVIPKGNIQTITVYNGDPKIPLLFNVAVSGAAVLSALSGVLLAAVGLSYT